ncbi:hypothetical protein XENOCAPTIV_020129 [Xenoophorus captivus]|uniref:Ribosomal RNA-processing protein 7 C-terminal domain-containing protein n=1 Tax=Xenoophorus captivus TaxID=1517983 RepID=A0ABV0SBQ3_9TELE
MLNIKLSFQVKDAREKLVQKDARFKIRGRGGAGGVQDARQMINSRKQGQMTKAGVVVLPVCPKELFCVCGALKRARLVKVGVAEVVFVRKEDAVSAYRRYNNRCLDELCQIPMHMPMVYQEGFKVGYIVFESSSSLAAAKSHPHDDPLVVSTEQRPVKTGVQKSSQQVADEPLNMKQMVHVTHACLVFLPATEWIQQYTKSFIHPDKLQLTVDSFMQDYDKRKEEEAERQRQEVEKQQEDEEGWVKVTRGHKGAKARPHSEAANKRTLQREIRKKRRKELMNFYTWQHRNTQKERKFIIF